MSYDIEKVEAPRLVHLQKGDSGYGFNLHGDKNQPGQTISAVDKDSPAEVGGLREGDRLIEVNGDNVESKAHGDVVKLIKERPNETTLLVCDKDTLAYLKAHNRECTVDLVNLQTVIPKPEEPAPVIANGNATSETVQEISEESAPSVETTPPPTQVTKDEDETAVAADTTPEEVKQLNSVLDEQEKPVEPVQQQVAEQQPQNVEQTDSKPEPQTEEPAKSVDKSGLVFDMQSARPSGNKRKSAKTAGAWSSKVNVINSL